MRAVPQDGSHTWRIVVVPVLGSYAMQSKGHEPLHTVAVGARCACAAISGAKANSAPAQRPNSLKPKTSHLCFLTNQQRLKFRIFQRRNQATNAKALEKR